MRLDIRGRSVPLAVPLQAYVARRVRVALGRFADRVGRIRIRVDDPGCRVDLVLGGRRLTVEETDRDLRAAIDRATERAGRVAERTLARLQTT